MRRLATACCLSDAEAVFVFQSIKLHKQKKPQLTPFSIFSEPEQSSFLLQETYTAAVFENQSLAAHLSDD